MFRLGDLDERCETVFGVSDCAVNNTLIVPVIVYDTCMLHHHFTIIASLQHSIPEYEWRVFRRLGNWFKLDSHPAQEIRRRRTQIGTVTISENSNNK